MQPKILTDAAVRRLKAPPGKVVHHSDAGSPLVARVSGPSTRYPEGFVSWISRPRFGGRQLYLSHGTYPAMPLEAARAAARAAAEAIRRGDAPAELTPTPGRARAPVSDEVEAVFETFVARYLEQRDRAPGYVRNVRGIFGRHVLPEWRGRDIKTISRREVIDLLDGVVDRSGPIAGNRCKAAISKLFKWSMMRGIVEVSPAAGIEKPGKEGKRDRVLDDGELALVWRAATSMGYPFGTLFRLLALLGQRRVETATMRWEDIDLAEGLWTLPAASTKPDRLHIVPLAPAVVDLLESLPRIGAHVLTTSGETAIGGFSKGKAQLDRLVAAAALDVGVSVPGAWVIHDLRRSCATGMAKLGVQRFTIARVLNHADTTVTGGYDRYDNLAEKRAALTTWADHVTDLVRPKLVMAAAG